MTVYVDTIRDYGTLARDRGLPSTKWCHMTADTKTELHKFAIEIGLKRSWFQDHPTLWHYDITPNKRKLALREGAVEITTADLIEQVLRPRIANVAKRTGVRNHKKRA